VYTERQSTKSLSAEGLRQKRERRTIMLTERKEKSTPKAEEATKSYDDSINLPV
jgi:hypothetical protein